MNVKQETLNAEKRIRKYIRETPLEFSPYLSTMGNSNVFLKMENLQITGSFKLRGAFNKILSLSEEERNTGVVTASSGNHGAACAYVYKELGINGSIVLPEIAVKAKIEAMRLYGAKVEFYGNDCVKAEIFARAYAEKNNLVYIPPYNDPYIIGGQGTIGVELERRLEKIDAVLIPVGGGGLIAGIAGYLKEMNGNIEIIGCQPENSAVMYESVKAGRILDLESKPTISDGSAGGIEQGSITFNLCRKYVDDFIVLSEEEIKDALKLTIEKHYVLVEGSAVLSVAAFLKLKDKFRNKNVVLLLSGSKISLETLQSIL